MGLSQTIIRSVNGLLRGEMRAEGEPLASLPDEALARGIELLRQGCRDYEDRFQLQGLMGHAYYHGFQDYVVNPSTRSMGRPLSPPTGYRVTDNLLKPACDTLVANLTRSRPKGVLETRHAEDTQTASVVSAVSDEMEALESLLELDEVREKRVLAALLTGIGYTLFRLDPLSGNPDAQPLDFVEVHPEPERRMWKDVRYVLWDPVLSWRDVERMAGTKSALITPGTYAQASEAHRKLAEVTGGSWGAFSRIDAAKVAQVTCAWFLPTGKGGQFPNGAYIITAGNVVLHREKGPDGTDRLPREYDCPWRGPMLPIVPMRYPQATRFLWGQTPTPDGIHLNARHNHEVYTFLSWQENSATGIMAIPPNCQIVGGRIPKGPGERVIYLSAPAYGTAQMPMLLTPQNMPPAFWEFWQWNKRQMDDTLGVYDVNRGVAPVGAETAHEVDIIEEASNSRNDSPHKQLEKAEQWSMDLLLSLWLAKNMRERTNLPLVQALVETRGRWRVVPGSSVNRSPAAKSRKAMELFQIAAPVLGTIAPRALVPLLEYAMRAAGTDEASQMAKLVDDAMAAQEQQAQSQGPPPDAQAKMALMASQAELDQAKAQQEMGHAEDRHGMEMQRMAAQVAAAHGMADAQERQATTNVLAQGASAQQRLIHAEESHSQKMRQAAQSRRVQPKARR